MKHINSYSSFERVTSNMARGFGRIKKGTEENFAFVLYPIEGNLLKINRKNGVSNGRRAMEAIKICLFKIEGYLNGWEYDFGQYLTDDNKEYVDVILYAVDPFVNEEIAGIISQWHDMNSSEDMREYFSLPVKCLIRIDESIQTWTNQGGASGYFDFLENQLGVKIDDEKMNYTVAQRKS
jgi:hypothetical protein